MKKLILMNDLFTITEFQGNRSISFGDSFAINRQQTEVGDRQTESGDLLFHNLGSTKRRQIMELTIRDTELLVICTSPAYAT